MFVKNRNKGGVMIITKKTEYATRAILFLSIQEKGKVILTRKIANQMEIPEQFLAQVMLALSKSDIVRAIRGANGGFVLNKIPSDISLRDVVEAIEGKLLVKECLISNQICKNCEICPMRDVWNKIQNQLDNMMAKTNFGQLSSSLLKTLSESKDITYSNIKRSLIFKDSFLPRYQKQAVINAKSTLC